ncbi:hypothetical protein LCGC14_1689630 [marine sediment metagenome]|uniref:Uncharacterized protein n=1 Tax=marine sediment metagenome TaxID=412755 RepID=A0A0F9HLP4_9ZZZZ
MPKLTAPLFSFRASGSLATEITYARSGKLNIVKSIPTHPDARSVAQLTHRVHFSNAVALWHLLSLSQRQSYTSPGNLLRLTGWQYFVKRYLIASLAPPPTEALYQNHQSGLQVGFAAYANFYWAQTFSPQTPHDLTQVQLYQYRIGVPPDVVIDIRETDTLGAPSTISLATASRPGMDMIPWPPAWFTYPLILPRLTPGITYAIVLSCPTGDVGNRVAAIRDNLGGYARGLAYNSIDSGLTWTSHPTRDFFFQTWGIKS